MIKCEKLCKAYAVGDSKQVILESIDFSIKEGDFVVIMGESGCGKSTFLNCISGMDIITSGKVYFDDIRLDQLSEKEIKPVRVNQFGYVFQDMNLVDVLNVEDNIALPLRLAKTYEQSKVKNLLKYFDIGHIASKFPSEISGGERQRAAIARAIINKPKVIFADEPTGSLDHTNTEKIMHKFSELNQNGQTIVMVTHDDFCASFGNRLVYLKEQTIIEQ